VKPPAYDEYEHQNVEEPDPRKKGTWDHPETRRNVLIVAIFIAYWVAVIAW
jgi:hypothetical protein